MTDCPISHNKTQCFLQCHHRHANGTAPALLYLFETETLVQENKGECRCATRQAMYHRDRPRPDPRDPVRPIRQCALGNRHTGPAPQVAGRERLTKNGHRHTGTLFWAKLGRRPPIRARWNKCPSGKPSHLFQGAVRGWRVHSTRPINIHQQRGHGVSPPHILPSGPPYFSKSSFDVIASRNASACGKT